MLMQTLLRGVVRAVIRPTFNPAVSIPRQRSLLTMATRLRLMPRDVRCEMTMLGGVAAQRLTAANADGCAVLYLHGGAYCAGSPETHRNLASHLAHAAGCTVYTLDYRLAPEHPFPAGLDDALAAYCALLAQDRVPTQLAIAGDSAGGGLTLALAQRIRDEKLPLPAALYLLSPWVDLTFTGETLMTRAAVDPMVTEAWIRAGAAHYVGTNDPANPLISPLFADCGGLPPMLIQVGSDEILNSDAERLAARAKAAGVDVQLSVHPGLWHVFQVFAGMLPPATTAVRVAGEYLRRCWI